MTKCISSCAKVVESECNLPRCRYIRGSKREYCKLSQKYVMKKPQCRVTRKIKKGDEKQNARNVIGRMFKKSGIYLQTICSDSGVCIAFGKNVSQITDYFNGFVHFYYMKSFKQIGTVSTNGFVNEISYERNGYKSYSILKSSNNVYADNLVYEYLVGVKYINRILKLSPCFIETYGLLYYTNEQDWNDMKTKNANKDLLDRLDLQNQIDYRKACANPKLATVMVQHIKDAISFDTMLKIRHFQSFCDGDMLHTLFIIYHTLSMFSKTFTHYDLHTENVLLYQPIKGKYIVYHYVNADGSETSFCSPYIPKIIDYGRSFFDNGNINSKKIYDTVCAQCTNCGEYSGFGWLKYPYNPRNHNISTSEKNESHDLRLMSIVKKARKTSKIIATTETGRRMIRLLNLVHYQNTYGTPENLSTINQTIYNVGGAYKSLKTAVDNVQVVQENNAKYNLMQNKLGDLYIYMDGKPMKYQSV